MDAVYFTASVPVLLPTRVYPPSVEKLLYFILSHILADARSHSLTHSLTNKKKKKKGSEFAPAELVGQYMLVRTHSTILRYLCLFILYVAEHSPAPKMMETV